MSKQEYFMLSGIIEPGAVYTQKQIENLLSVGGHQGYINLKSIRDQFFKPKGASKFCLEPRFYPKDEPIVQAVGVQVKEEKIKEDKPGTYVEPIFSFFRKPITNRIPSREITLYQVYQALTGEYYQKKTAHLRGLTGKNQKDFKAQNFDYVTFSGTFNSRKESDIVTYSGLLVLDFDHLSDYGYSVASLRKILASDEKLSPELIFCSPGGDGLKVVVEIDKDQSKHRKYFHALQSYISRQYKIELDQSGKDICRACFLCYDPNTYLNPHRHGIRRNSQAGR